MAAKAAINMPKFIATPQSSSVEQIGYDAKHRELWVTFHDSDTYIYEDVPEQVWEDFRHATSKGAFVNTVVKPDYAVRKRSIGSHNRPG